jgi:multiple sugar transport system permease protein
MFGKKFKKSLVVMLAIVVAAFFIIPIAWMFSTSIKTDVEAVDPNLHWVPEDPTIRNYEYTLIENKEETPVLRWGLNSIFVSLAGTLLVVTVDALCAYALARLNLPFKNVLFAIFIATMMVPWVVIFLPLYLEFSAFKMLDTYWPLIIPYSANAFGVFLLRQFFLNIPSYLEEAAMIDGANKLRIFWSVVLPLARPALLALGVFTFITIYNDFLWPLIATSSVEMRTATVGIAIMQLGSFVTSPGKLMALTALATIPMFTVFLIAQKYFIQGVSFTGGKE